MSAVLHFGLEDGLELDLPKGVLVGCSGEPQGEPLEDVAAALRQAVETPREFPSLNLATVPGDQIVIAVDAAVPQLPHLVAALVEWLVEHDTAAHNISILSGLLDDSRTDPRSALSDALRSRVGLLIHDPEKADQHCHLANAEDGHEYRIHRALFDADLILPIGCLFPRNAWSYHGIHGVLFPAFSDASSQQRFHDADQIQTASSRKRLAEEVKAAAWNLGVIFTIQVIPGGDDRILQILAGDPTAVRRVGEEQYAVAWRHEFPQRAELVIAAVSGGPEQQTWDNVARAVATALPLVVPQGAIVVCTSLSAEPGPAVQRLAGANDAEQALRRIRKQHSADAPVAAQLAQALEQAKIYLFSAVDEATIEELGIAPIADPVDLARLARRSPSCILLAHAQHVSARVVESSNDDS